MTTENENNTGAPPSACAAHGYPLRSLEEFASWLIAHGLVDECAYWDADGYDGGRTLERMSRALKAATDRRR